MDDRLTFDVERNAVWGTAPASAPVQHTATDAERERHEFLSHISHEIKTPLNAIIGFTEILKESVTEPTLLHYLNIIRNSGDTLLSIVRDNLELTKPAPDVPPLAQCKNMRRTANEACDAADRIYVAEGDNAAQADRVLVVGSHALDGTMIDTCLDDARKAWKEYCAGSSREALKNCIFAVDDNEDNLGMIIHFFSKENIRVFPFSNGDEVLDALTVATPNLILLDIIMPGMDGYEICRRIKERDAMKSIPIIFLTGKSETDDIVRGFQLGGVDYISKPFRKEELVSRVRTHLKLYLAEQSLKEALSEKDKVLNETLKGSVRVLVDILAMTNPEAFAQTLRVRNVAKKMCVRLALPNAWEIEIGVLLSHLGRAVLPPEIIRKKQSGEKLTSQECAVFNSHPKAAARFIANIPGFEHIAQSIQNQMSDYNPHGEPDVTRDFIRVIFDYDNLIQSGCTQQQALDEMNRKAERYNQRVLGALEAEVRRLMDGYVVRTVLFEELRTGMVLADDIRNASNIILVRRNSELSEVLLERLQNLRYCGRTYEPVKILEQITA
ncbi:MAG: response regulator [Acidobacteriota bacterium]